MASTVPSIRAEGSRITNLAALAQHGMGDLRTVALQVAEAGLRAADPRTAVRRTVHLTGDRITVGTREYELADYDRILFLGVGKASLKVLLGLEDVLGDLITTGLVVVPRDQPGTSERVQVMKADHPLPSPASVRAAECLLNLARSATRRDLIVCSITGGSSALACSPCQGVTFTEKRDLNERLLASGAGIDEINAVRKHVSAIKGGRLARAASPAAIINLTICDVTGCQEDLVTDPTVRDTSTTRDAVQVLKAYRLWDKVGEGIRTHLRCPLEAESPTLDNVDIHTEMMVTGYAACSAMARTVVTLNRTPIVLGDGLATEARGLGPTLAALASSSARRGQPFPRGSVLVACGGESTVGFDSGRGRFGEGGPNQELIVGAALSLAPTDRVAIVAIDTDGADGSTKHAGAIADGLTRSRAQALGLDLRQSMLEHRTAQPLAALGDHVQTGPTGTNINDLVVLAVG